MKWEEYRVQFQETLGLFNLSEDLSLPPLVLR